MKKNNSNFDLDNRSPSPKDIYLRLRNRHGQIIVNC